VFRATFISTFFREWSSKDIKLGYGLVPRVPRPVPFRIFVNFLARTELWSVRGWETGTRAVLFSMVAEAGGLKRQELVLFWYFVAISSPCT